MDADHSPPGLENRAYTAAEVLANERDSIFASGWVSVGLASALTPGSALPINVAGVPLLVTRTRDGVLHALHNVCRHRGLRLLSTPCEGLRELTCPYHAWRYKLSGAFAAAPYHSGSGGTHFPKDQAERLGLIPVRHHVFFDVIFVNLSGEAQAFADWIAPLAELWKPFESANMQMLSSTDYDLGANWKLVCENFLDNYHVPFVHAQAGGPETALNFEDLSLAPDLFGFTLPGGEADKRKPEWLPRLELPPELQDAQFLFCLFPNTLLIMTAGWFQVISVQPAGAERSTEFLGLYLMDEIHETDRIAAEDFSEFMNGINRQDAILLPELQAGKHSPVAERGTLAPYWEETVQRFQRRVRGAPEYAGIRLGSEPK